MTKVFYVAVHHTLIAIKVIAPELREQHLAGKHTAGGGNKGVKQLKFACRQLKRTPVQSCFVSFKINAYVAVMQYAVRTGTAAAPEDNPDFFELYGH